LALIFVTDNLKSTCIMYRLLRL